MKYHFKIHKERRGYWAECIELSGCQTQADSIKALVPNMKEALELFLSEPENSKVIFPQPLEKKPRNSIPVKVDPDLAFAVNLRQLRLRHGFTQKQIAQKLAMRNLYSYQRLEEPGSNPTLDTLIKLKRVYGDELEVDQILDVQRD